MESLIHFLGAVFLVGVVGYVIYVLMNNADENKAYAVRQENLKALNEIASVVEKLTANLNASTDLKSKKKRAETIIQSLDSAVQYPEYQEVFDNFDELYEQVTSMLLVAPVIEHLRKAHKFRFKKKDSSEKNALLDAMYEIEQNNITDDDFVRLGSHNEETGEIISIPQIEERLKELGWEK